MVRVLMMLMFLIDKQKVSLNQILVFQHSDTSASRGVEEWCFPVLTFCCSFPLCHASRSQTLRNSWEQNEGMQQTGGTSNSPLFLVDNIWIFFLYAFQQIFFISFCQLTGCMQGHQTLLSRITFFLTYTNQNSRPILLLLQEMPQMEDKSCNLLSSL